VPPLSPTVPATSAQLKTLVIWVSSVGPVALNCERRAVDLQTFAQPGHRNFQPVVSGSGEVDADDFKRVVSSEEKVRSAQV
jgi:hypothetical protein